MIQNNTSVMTDSEKGQSLQTTEEINPIAPMIDLKVKNRYVIFSPCHRIPSRSLHIRGKPVICYRCLGLNGGFLLIATIQLITLLFLLAGVSTIRMGAVLEAFGGDNLWMHWLFVLLTQLPFVIDGGLQALIPKYESNNPIRLLTGTIGGIGQFYFMYVLGEVFAFFFA